MGISGKSPLTEKVLKVFHRKENKFRHTARELRVVKWIKDDGTETAPSLQTVEKRVGLGNNEYVTGTKGMSPEEWTAALANKDEITELMIPMPHKQKQEFHDHD